MLDFFDFNHITLPSEPEPAKRFYNNANLATQNTNLLGAVVVDSMCA